MNGEYELDNGPDESQDSSVPEKQVWVPERRMYPDQHRCQKARSSHLRITYLLAGFVVAGCSTPDPPGVEKGLHNTIAYVISIEASEPGTKIEVNHEMVGPAPLTVKVFGDRDGTFHNFGSDEYVVRAFPARPEQYPQTRIFRTGAFGIKDDKIPQRIYFNFGPVAGKPKPEPK
jgi:hypothetical protein